MKETAASIKGVRGDSKDGETREKVRGEKDNNTDEGRRMRRRGYGNQSKNGGLEFTVEKEEKRRGDMIDA